MTFFILIYIIKYLFSIALSIFIGILIFMMTEPMAKALHKRGMKKVVASSIAIIVFLAIIIGIGVTLGVIFTTGVNSLAHSLPIWAHSLEKNLTTQSNTYLERFNALPAGVILKIKEYIAQAATKISTFASGFLLGIFGFFTSISKIIVNITIGVIFSFFLSLDIEIIKKVFREKAPKGIQTSAKFLKDHVFSGIWEYVKAQLKLITITFLVVLISLFIINYTIINVDNIFTMAILAGIFDVLPLLGISTLFIPWIIYLLIVGNITLAISLAIVLGIVVTLRQILEPKIVGQSLGVIASVMLASIIIFMNMLGLIGIIVSPILIILIRAIYAEGIFQKWLSMEKIEEAEKHNPEETST